MSLKGRLKKFVGLKKLIYHLRGVLTTEELVERGMIVGTDFFRGHDVLLDNKFCWLITIGDHVGLADHVQILCHDASTKSFTGYTKIGRVTIGDYVFVGAGSVILPGVTIGSRVVIGANCTVTHDIPDNSVVVGSPACRIESLDEYIARELLKKETAPVYGAEYALRGGVTPEMRKKLLEELKDGVIGYIP